MADKKMGPREQQLRELREQVETRKPKGKTKLDRMMKAKGIGRLSSIKGGKRGA